MQAYEYLFYRLYHYQSRNKWPSEAATVFVVSCLMTLLFLLNLLLLFEILELSFRGGKAELPSLPELQGISMILVLGYCHYLFWRHNERYKQVAEKFEREPVEGRRLRNLMVRLYVTLSFLLPFGAAILRGWLLGTL